MKKILFIAILALGFSACQMAPPPVQTYRKPFIIVFKTSVSTYEAKYTFQDADGNAKDFYEYVNKYSVGDTLN